jgi:predicted membrane protein
VASLESRPRDGEKAAPTRAYGSVVMGAILVIVGGLWLLDAVDVISLRAAVVLPAVLAVVGIALIVGAFDGPHSGLVVLGMFLSIAVVLAAVTPQGFISGGVGDRRYTVTDEAQLETEYRLGAGNLRLDLRGLEVTGPRTVQVSVTTGEMRIELPEGLPVDIRASVGAGKVDLLGATSDGLSVTRNFTSPDFDAGAAGLTLDLQVTAGEIEVRR